MASSRSSLQAGRRRRQAEQIEAAAALLRKIERVCTRSGVPQHWVARIYLSLKDERWARATEEERDEMVSALERRLQRTRARQPDTTEARGSGVRR